MESGYNFDALFNEWDKESETGLVSFLNKIECPENFRGLFNVIGYLEQLSNIHARSFNRVFAVDQSIFVPFRNVKEGAWKIYSMGSLERGSKSMRPTYSLLFTLSESNNQEIYPIILSFIRHFFENESIIKSEGREEQSMRAFRLLVTDTSTQLDRLQAPTSENMSDQLLGYRLWLKQQSGDRSNETFIGYLRDLEHFYRLDWRKRNSVKRSSSGGIRASYSRRKIERITGTEDLYTLALNQLQPKQFDLENGLDAKEDLPPLSIVKQLPEIDSKPAHELPDLSAIKDKNKARWQKRIIERNLAKSHNLTSISRTVLQPHELFYLLESLKRRKSTTEQRHNTQSVLLLSLLFGVEINAIKAFKRINDETDDGFGFFRYQGRWYRKVKHENTAKMGKHQLNPNLYPTKPYTIIVIPAFLVNYIKLESVMVGQKVLGLSSVAIELKRVQSYLKAVNKKYHCQISYKSVCYHLSNKSHASSKHDQTILESLSGESNYYSRSMRHYIWRSDRENTEQIYKLWNTVRTDAEQFAECKFLPEFHLPVELANQVKPEGVGSQFTPKTSAIRQLVQHLKMQLKTNSTFEVSNTAARAIEYHNSYTLYTAYMLLNATGYRAVHNPLPSVALHLLRYDAICISDKDARKSFAHSRIVAVPQVLKTQLLHYAEHLNAMGNLLAGVRLAESASMHWHIANKPLLERESKVERIDWFLGAKHSRANDGVFNLLEPETIRSRNINPKQIIDLTPEHLRLPVNFGRHYIRRYLLEHDAPLDLVNAQLGHWVSGELPLSHLSTFEHCLAISEINAYLDVMMDELEWQAMPSMITRKRT